jgi:cysteinyl-tRNA synthetase
VIFAALNMDSDMRDLWAHAQTRQSQLISHWKKFQRWTEESHLHGNADFDKALQQFHNASQTENEDPVTFYARLSKLAAAIEKDFDMVDFFPRLNPGLRATLTRNDRKGANLNQLLRNAQEVWGTFTNKQQRKRTLPPDSSTTKRTQTQRQSSGAQTQQPGSRPYSQYSRFSLKSRQTNIISNEERQRRIDNQLCFKCGKPNHLAKDCESQGSPTPKAQSQSEPPKSQSVTCQSINQARGTKN